jgi:uncharacterized protein
VSRLLWWLIIGLGAWWLIKRLRVDGKGGGASAAAPTPGAPSPTESAQRDPLVMVRCAHCGVHLPQSEALFDDTQRSYCSAAHRAAGAR